MTLHACAILVVLVACAAELPGQSTEPSTRRARRAPYVPRMLYVAPAGDDTNAGSEQAPFRSIQKGADSANPGDTIIIADGTYAERVALKRSGAYFGRFITFKAASAGKVILDAKGVAGSARAIFDTAGQDYIVISGITVQNGGGWGIGIAGSWQVFLENCRTYNTAASGIMVDKSGTVRITNCEVEKACATGEESISIKRSQDVLVEKSHIHHTGHEGIDVKEGSKHVRIMYNHLHDVERQALYAEAWDSPTSDIRFEGNVVHDSMFGIAAGSECGGELADVTIANNVVYNLRGPGIILADWGPARFKHPVRNVRIIHNTVYGCGRPEGGWGGGMVFENSGATDITVINNIFAKNPSGDIRVVNGKLPSNLTVTNNLLGTGVDGFTSNSVGDAAFADAAAADFRLTATSRALDAATDDPAVTLDLTGRPRKAGTKPDLGAYERPLSD